MTPRNRKAPPCPKCGRPIEYYAAMGEWWCGSAGCQTRTSAPPGAEPTPGRKRAQPKTSAPSPAVPTPAADAHAEPVAVLVTLSDVQPEEVRWLWPGRIPQGKLTILAGPPGVGKSFALLDIAARVSRGSPLPDSSRAPLGVVVVLTAEDGLADTVRPRLDMMGADCERIHALTGVRTAKGEGVFSLEEHLGLLETEIVARSACLAIIDPLLAYTGRSDSYKDSEVRGLLAPLAAMAERTSCAIVGVIHLNKRGGERSPLNRITGSIAFVAAARSVLLLSPDPDDDTGQRRVLAPVKMNLCAPPPSLALHFAEDGGLLWDGPVDKRAEDLLADPTDDGDRSARTEAEEFLRETLPNGPVEVKEVQRQAREAGINERTLRWAKEHLGIRSHREGGIAAGGRWVWSCAPNAADSSNMTSPTNIEKKVTLDRPDTNCGQGEDGKVILGRETPADGSPVCPHRPPGEADDRWAHGDGGPDSHVCRCCGASVRPELWADGLCSVCRNGQRAKEGSGHLVRLALDLGARPVEAQR